MSHLSYVEAVVVGALQGVSELFPVSSVGHSVLLPAVVGGSWARDLDVRSPESPYLAFIVGLHVATAVALLVFFRRDWVRIVRALLAVARTRRVRGPDERLAVLLVLATIPVGVSGLLLEHAFRTLFSRPVPTAVFLVLNGLVLGASGQLTGARHRAQDAPDAQDTPDTRNAQDAWDAQDGQDAPEAVAADRRLAAQSTRRAVLVGAAQISALLPGFSRSGMTMVAGLRAGLATEDAARFSFLLATPVILAAGVLKVPDLFGPLGRGIHGQVLAGSLCSGVGAYLSVRFLTRWFRTRSLVPFGVYCTVLGLLCLVWFAVR